MTDHCEDYVSWLVRAADDLLDDASRARLEIHLATCASCAEALADQRRMRTLLASQPALGAPWGFEARVIAALQPAASWIDLLDVRRWTWRLVPLAAALALVAAGVSRTDESTEVTATSAAASTLPVSSALWSGAVSESSLLSLMLNANADDLLTSHVPSQMPSQMKEKQP